MEVRYLLRGGVLEGEFQNDGVRLGLLDGRKLVSQVRMRLVGSRVDAAITGGGAPEGHTSYLLGNDPAHWLRGLPNYREVRYSKIYTGTDLVFYGNGGALEHDFELQPGADPSRIAFQLDGAESVVLGDNGDLRIGLAGGAITLQRPVAYQIVSGARRVVDAAFEVDKDGTIRFRVGSYDSAQKLVIDPVLSFSTYLSPLAPDANLIATDASGNNYVAGYATLGFPVTSGAFAGCANCTANGVVTFVSKLSADGADLLYSTVLGGNGFAQPTGIAVDGNGNAIVSGWTGASDFPTKNGQPTAPPNNADLGFLVSLSADGSSLNFGTMLGSPPSVSPAAMTYASAVAVDSSGNAYVTGDTGDGFFTTAGALNQAAASYSRNSFDVFLAKFSPAGSLIYGAVLGTADPQNGGGGPIGATSITVDAAGDAFVAGQAGTLWPISSNAYLKQIAGSMPYATPFVMEVAPDAKSTIYSTYLDYAYVVTGIAASSNGNVFVTGNEAGASYPTTADAYQPNSGGGSFLTELNSTGSGLAYSTIVGDPSYSINGLALDADGDIWLAGETSNSQFPLVAPIQATFPSNAGLSGPVSALMQFDPTGRTLKFSTFLGGNAPGYASGVAIDAHHRAHVSGAAGYGMYTTPGVYAGSVPTPGSAYGGATYAYVSLIDTGTSTGTLCLGGSAASGLSFGYLLPQTSASQMVKVTNCGSAPLAISSVTSNNAAFAVPTDTNSCIIGSLPIGSSCSVIVQFTPAAAQAYSGQLSITSNSSIATTSISLNGSGGEPIAGFGPPGVTQSLFFSPLLVGQTSAAQSIGLYNNGQVPLTIYLSQIAVTSGFALAPGGNCPASLPAHQSCWISVVFAPTTTGAINGTLSVSSSDPVHPTISATLTGTAFSSYPMATITALLNPSYPIQGGTGSITMRVIGSNFFPTSVVYIDGAPQTTTYESGSSLSVKFGASLLNAVGQIPVTVVNPTPGGGSSAAYPLIGYLSIPLTASALTVDPVGGLLYASIPSNATQNPNTVIPINPATGATMTPIAVAMGPRALAVSDDGSELYVASAGVLQRINLKTQAVEKSFNLPVDPEWGQTYVQEMHVVPGSPQSIVVELFANVDPAEDGAALYNDSGLVNWIPGVGSSKNSLELDSFTFTSPAAIYGLPEGSAFFAELQVSPAGLSTISPAGFSCCNENTGSMLASDGTMLYTNSGEVWDPVAQKLVGTYLESNGSQLFYAPSVLPDTANGKTYFLDGDAQYSQYQAVSIDVYNQATFALLGTVPFTTLYPPDVTDLVRWGNNGFAFRCTDFTGTDSSENQIVVVTSNLVAGSNAAPVPILSSVSPSTVVAGGPDFTLQLNGSGFTSASTALINGSPRTTNYVSGTSLTAQVLASDIVANGQLNVQVSTPPPGGGTSNDVVVSLTPSPISTPTVTVTPSLTSITTAQALSVTVTVSAGSGKATPTGSVVLSGGGYSSPAASLSGGTANIPVPAGSLSTGTDTLTVAYSPDSGSSATYRSATGSTSVTVTAPGKNASTVTVTPVSSTITNEQSDTVSIVVAGVSGQPAPTGTVTLTSGTYSAQQTLATGTASIAIPAGALSSGADTLTSTYSGDGTYAGSSGTASVTVAQIVISAPSPSGVSPGGSATTTVTLSAGSNYAGTMNLNCTLLSSPTGAQSVPTCNLSPKTVNIATGGNGSTVLTVQTTAASTTALLGPIQRRLLGLGGGTILAGLLLIGVPARRRRWMAIVALVWVVLAAGASGCGGGSSTGSGPGGTSIPGTTPGTYRFTVTGADSVDSSITTSTAVSVTVQ